MGDAVEFGVLVDALPDVVFVIDPDVRLRYVNAAAGAVLGWERDEWLGRSALDVVHPDDIAIVISSTDVLRGKRSGTPVEVRVKCSDGSWKWLEIIGADALETAGVGGLICVARDITQRRMWEVAAGETARFQQVVQHAASITLLIDAHGRIASVNGAFARLTGHDPTLVVGRELSSFVARGQADLVVSAIERSHPGERGTCEVHLRLADGAATIAGATRPIRFEFVNLLDDPVVAGIVVTGYDVSDLYRARAELEHLATHDALTGLANRTLLLEELHEVVAERQPAAVVFVDLDRFKPVNDLLGHEAGDELLRLVSERLVRVVRPNDLVARVGGDEFVVLARGVADRANGVLLCERIDAALVDPYQLAAGPVRISASVGMSVADNESNVAGLLADADIAMYEAKAARRGVLRSLPERRQTATQRRRLADDLAIGMQRGEVVAHLQPIVDIATNRTTAYESLARWYHPDLGTLDPVHFLDLSEDAGLDLLLGDLVLDSACALFARTGIDASTQLCVNLSVGQLADKDLCSRVAVILARHGVKPDQLVVEITEHATLVRRPGGGRVSPETTLLDLRAMGASLSLDDFGTGYSSLTYIRRFPLSAIKVDRSFVIDVQHHIEDRAVVAAVVGMAGALGLQVVGEGVETVEQLEALRRLGCHAVQGYLLSRPLDSVGLTAWVNSGAANDWRVANATT